ncbi:MAG TPA: hypothetical protein VK217_04335 [Acidimicrobiales bacterium]|nr:hypothetical protein [Acidimicrobiales bacterium]
MDVEARENSRPPRVTDGAISDAELTALAIAADPDAPVGPDAIPFALCLAQSAGLLPQWYMPPPATRSGGKWRTPVVLAIVVALLLIEALGLCSTYGQVVVG